MPSSGAKSSAPRDPCSHIDDPAREGPILCPAVALLGGFVVQYLRRKAKRNPLEGYRPA